MGDMDRFSDVGPLQPKRGTGGLEQMGMEPNNGPSGGTSANGGPERPVTDQIATVIWRLTEAYLGDAYKNRHGCSQMGAPRRWLNATFGSVTFFFSVLIITLLAPLRTADAPLSRLSVLLDTTSGIIGIGTVALVFPAVLSFVTASSIQRGGPLRLYISGVVVASLPFVMQDVHRDLLIMDMKAIHRQPVRLTMAAILVVILITALGSVAYAQEQESCNVPDMITVAGRQITAVSGEPVRLDPIDFPTTLKWAAALLFPELARDEVGIYLYDLQELDTESNIGMNDRHVLWFIVCNQGKSYWARLGKIGRPPLPMPSFQQSGTLQQSGAFYDGLYLGTTIPVPPLRSGLTASQIMRGDLTSFPQSIQNQALPHLGTR